MTEITKSLKEVVGVLADVKKAVTDQQTGFEARLKKLEDLYVQDRSPFFKMAPNIVL